MDETSKEIFDFLFCVLFISRICSFAIGYLTWDNYFETI